MIHSKDRIVTTKLQSRICVVYLYRTTHLTADLIRFLDAFEKHTRSSAARLCIVVKGTPSIDQSAAIQSGVDALQDKFDTEIFATPDDCNAMVTYWRAAQHLKCEFLCFMNTYSEPLVSGWLEKLATPVLSRIADVAGATGAYEATLKETTFPNPSLRTNAFLINRELYLALEGVDSADRQAALMFENGQKSMTRQILEKGGRVVVVNGDGEAFDIHRCHEANAFRSLGPQNLLVADNRTREYETADEETKAKLRRFAWGGRKPRWRFFRSALRKARRLCGLS
jgi:hypothetical protein